MADVLIVIDDRPIVSEVLSQLITYKTDGKFRVVGTAQDISNAIKLADELSPDIVVVNIFIGDSSSFDFVRLIKRQFPQIKVLMISIHDESLYAERAAVAGADGYVMKQESLDDIINAISHILHERIFPCDEIAESQQQERIRRIENITANIHLLAKRERQVFELFGKGWTTRKIADELNLSVKTIETNCARIKKKLELKNANELIHQAVKWVNGSSPT